MAIIWNKIPTVVLTVVFVAVIGGIDVSYGCFSCDGKGSVVDSEDQVENISLSSSIVDRFQDSGSISNGGTTAVTRSYTKQKLFCMMLLAGIFTLGTKMIYNNLNSNLEKYDVEKEAKQVSLALGSSSASTQEKLDNITRALCTTLAGSTTESPLDISTLLPTTQRTTTDTDTTEAATTKVGPTEVASIKADTTFGKTTEIVTTEAITTVEPATTPIPKSLCVEVAAEIFPLIKTVVGYLKEGFIAFDVFSNTHIDYIKMQLGRIEGKYCKDGFFNYGILRNQQGLWFNYENEFVKLAMDNNTCKRAAEAVLPILNEMGHDSETNCIRGCFLEFHTDEMENKLREGLAISNGIHCGNDFFEYNDNVNGIRYKSSNLYISEVWIDAICSNTCQKRANGVIGILSQHSHSNAYKLETKTMKNSYGRRTELLAAWALASECDCGAGALTMNDRQHDRLIFSYGSANPYVIKAWENAHDISTCANTGKDVLDYLKSVNFFSIDEDVVMPIPDRKDHIITLVQKINAADGYDCKDGFFKYVEEDGYFMVKYKKSNPYIKPEWDKVSNGHRCTMTARGFFDIFYATGEKLSAGWNYIGYYYKSRVGQEAILKSRISEGLNCGENFFIRREKRSFGSYFIMAFKAGNNYVFNLYHLYVGTRWGK